MLKEGSAPTTTHKRGAKTILLGWEMSEDQGEDVQREAVYGNEGVHPLADSRQCSRGILVELRNLIQCEPIGEVSVLAAGLE